jgi:hypothetical protein
MARVRPMRLAVRLVIVLIALPMVAADDAK